MEREKRELIEAINEIRKELGLKPYPLEHLEIKSIEELKKFYSTYFQMREDYRKRLEEKRFKLNLKTGLLIVVPVMLVISLLLFTQFISKLQEKGRELLSFTPSTEETEVVKQPPEEELKFDVSFGYNTENLSVFLLSNEGTKNITEFTLLVDGEIKDYTIEVGKLPLPPPEILYFSTINLCDNKIHQIEIRIESETDSLQFNSNMCEWESISEETTTTPIVPTIAGGVTNETCPCDIDPNICDSPTCICDPMCA
jgi:hypothetical protein